MLRWSRPFLVGWLAVSPGVAMLACIYPGPLIGICLLADASRAAEPPIIVYFFLCVRAVASSDFSQISTLSNPQGFYMPLNLSIKPNQKLIAF